MYLLWEPVNGGDYGFRIGILADHTGFTLKTYELPIATVTNYHKLIGLKQHTFVTFQFWRPKV